MSGGLRGWLPDRDDLNVHSYTGRSHSMSDVTNNQDEEITTLDNHAPAPPKDGEFTTLDNHAPAPPKDGGITTMDNHAPAPPALGLGGGK